MLGDVIYIYIILNLYPIVFAGNICNESAKALRHYSPQVAKAFRPLYVEGDGNCLYRAVSLALYDTQNHHEQLRLLTAIEIEMYKSYYTKNRYFDFTFVIQFQNTIS